jgi:hypothetical protein
LPDCVLVNFHQNYGMRISDDRYSRERSRMELALRFLRHEARTQTIRAWTGLSDDRIRKLYRSYMSQARRQLPRHRGKSPHQVAYFTRSLRLQEETALLASMLSLLGVVPAGMPAAASAATSAAAVPPIAAGATAAARTTGATLPGVTRGELLCQAFEAFRLMLPSAQISFEHAVFLATALARGDQLRLGDCSDCGSLMVTERFPLRASRCTHCSGPAQPG